MATQRDYAAHVAILRDSIKNEDEKTGILTALNLLEFVLCDLSRIADALEMIATRK